MALLHLTNSVMLSVFGNPNSDLCCLAYPPSDLNVYYYFLEPQVRNLNNDTILECRYLAFFVALFTNAIPELEAALNEIPASDGSISQRW
jgi:hypothetical protein